MDYSNLQIIDVIGGNTLANQPDVTNQSVWALSPYYSADRFICETLAPLSKEVCNPAGELPDHYLNRLLNRKINDYADPFTTWDVLFHHANVYGNGYLLITRDAKTNRVTKLENLNPQSVRPFRVDGTKFYHVNNTDVILTDDEVIHVMGRSFNGICGVNPAQLLCQTFEKLQALETHQLNYWMEGTHVNGVFQTDAGLTKEQIATMRHALDAFRGAKNAGKSPLLPFGIKWSNTTSTNEASQVLELAKLGIDEVARITRVPPTALFSITGAGAWSTVEQLDRAVVKYTFRSWVEKLEAQLLKLFTPDEDAAGFYVNIDLDDILRGDSTRTDRTVKLFTSGLIKRSEAREAEGYALLGDGTDDTMLDPVNVGQKATDQTAPAAAEPAPATEQPATDYSAAMQPLVAHAINRVENKTQLAFDRHKTKSLEQYTQWQTKFAADQAEHLAAELLPVTAAFTALTGKTISTAELCSEYATSILHLAPDDQYNSTLLAKAGGIFQ